SAPPNLHLSWGRGATRPRRRRRITPGRAASVHLNWRRQRASPAGSVRAAEEPQESEQPRDHDHEADDGGEENGQRERHRRLPTDALLARGGGIVAHELLVRRNCAVQWQSDRTIPRALRVAHEGFTSSFVMRGTVRVRG